MTRQFYLELLGVTEGRSRSTWVDFNFSGHQITAHLDPVAPAVERTNEVDGRRCRFARGLG